MLNICPVINLDRGQNVPTLKMYSNKTNEIHQQQSLMNDDIALADVESLYRDIHMYSQTGHLHIYDYL